MIVLKRKFRLSAGQLLALGFLLIIFIGAVLLCLPAANRTQERISFLDALFTACSAACVTGLVVVDTWTQFTLFGQIVILVLIQLGGLGFMTFAMLFFMALGKRISLSARVNVSEAVGAFQIGGVVRLVRLILFGTFYIETVGTVLLASRFVPVFGWARGIWYGVFHAVSAFCNAGFDLMGTFEPYSSLTYFADDAVVNLTVMALILIGGIGFVVWDDLHKNGLRFRKYELHTKLVLTFTAALLVLPTLLFLWTEKDGVFAGMEAGERLLAALFSSVTPRTAGFNTVDTAALSESGKFMTMLLMLIGAGSGSTGGGIKISTFAVMVLSLCAYVRRREEADAWGRRLEPQQCRRAFCSVLYYLSLAVMGIFLLTAGQEISLTDAVFECLSAIGTVGMSTGVTRNLTFLSKAVIIILMYCGRIGSLTVFMAMTPPKRGTVRCPTGRVMIG